MLSNLLSDVRYSLRGFARRPTFAVVVVLTLALGAEPARVRAMVLKQVGWMAAVGVPVGLVAALLLGRLAAALLYGLTPTEPAAYVAACALLTAVVFGASYLPARRASRVDPVVALRAE